MKVNYLEIVASDVDAVCAAYEAAHGIKFGSADPLLGGARTAPLPDGGSIGVRGPLRDTEEPVVRPYWLVDDIEAALGAASRRFGCAPPAGDSRKGYVRDLRSLPTAPGASHRRTSTWETGRLDSWSAARGYRSRRPLADTRLAHPIPPSTPHLCVRPYAGSLPIESYRQ